MTLVKIRGTVISRSIARGTPFQYLWWEWLVVRGIERYWDLKELPLTLRLVLKGRRLQKKTRKLTKAIKDLQEERNTYV